MNKITRICIFVLLICLVLLFLNFALNSVLYVKEQFTMLDNPLSKGYANSIVRGLTYNIVNCVISAIFCIVLTIVIIANRRCFFENDENSLLRKESKKQRKLQQLKNKIEELKGDE